MSEPPEEERGPITEEDIAHLSASDRRHEAAVPEDRGTVTLSSDNNGDRSELVGNTEWSSPEFKIKNPPPLRKASITPTQALIAASRMAAAPATRGVLFDHYEELQEEDEMGRRKGTSDRKPPFWERLTAKGNRVGANDVLSTSDEEYGQRRMRDTKTGKAVRQMRKMVSITSKNKSKTSQEDLATAVVAGNLLKTEQIVDAFVALYRAEGFKTITSFK